MSAEHNHSGHAARPEFGRRHFLQAAGAAGLALAARGEAGADDSSDAIPRRPFGRHKDMISILGLGGHHLGDPKYYDDAEKIVHEALEAGVNFFDNCWEYWNGRAEDWLGRALRGKRDKAFLMTKVCTHGRDAKLAMKMLEESLRRLQTDHLDLWQIHAISFDNDPELAYAKDGVIEALEQAKKQGKTRYVGFTGHKDPSFHLKMLQMGYAFDSVQMPLNPCDGTFRSFEQIVLPEATKRGVAVLGMKSLGGTADMVKKGLVKAEEAIRYAMSLPVTTTICGVDTLDVLHQNLKVARGFKPMTAEEMADLRKRCAPMAADGRYEIYKSSLKFDNPETRLPHDFPLDPLVKEAGVKEE
jgi:aryl-alcohol dehydrogenase-like predicted oxidoreductase